MNKSSFDLVLSMFTEIYKWQIELEKIKKSIIAIQQFNVIYRGFRCNT